MKIPYSYDSYGDYISRLYREDGELDNTKALNIIKVPNITFQVTDDCNLNCSYCYQINKGHHKMPLSIAKQFIDLLFENNEQAKQYIDIDHSAGVILDFIGGEPFLEVELIDQIIEYFQQVAILKQHIWARNWRINISTNGTLYFTDAVQKFINKYNKRLSLGITVDGNKQLHDSCRKFPNGEGSYDLASAAAYDYMYNLKRQLGSKITFSIENIQYVADAIKDFIKFGYTNIHANCVFEKGWELEHAKIFYNQLKDIADYFIANDLEEKIYFSLFNSNNFVPLPITQATNWCGGNGKMLTVDYNGDIFPCIRYTKTSLGENIKPIIIGNVKTGILTTDEEKKLVYDLKMINRINQSTQECIECPIAQGCAYCQAYNYQDSGVFNHRATYTCIMHKATALANAYYWNQCYKKHNESTRMHLYLPENEALKIISKEEYDKIKKMELL